jgi:hypothetical protein
MAGGIPLSSEEKTSAAFIRLLVNDIADWKALNNLSTEVKLVGRPITELHKRRRFELTSFGREWSQFAN